VITSILFAILVVSLELPRFRGALSRRVLFVASRFNLGHSRRPADLIICEVHHLTCSPNPKAAV
jgi:hypothetical protein